MKLISGTIVYGINDYLENNFSGYLHQSFLSTYVEIINHQEYLVNFQNSDYLIRVEKIEEFNCTAISILSNYPSRTSNNRIEILQQIGTGIPKLIREHIILNKKMEWCDCKMLSPEEFKQTLSRISEREIFFRELRQLYLENFDENANFVDSQYQFNPNAILINNKIEKTKQPWTFRVLETENIDKPISQFFIKIGIELDWDNSIYFDSYFIPTYIDEMLAKFRIGESKEYIENLFELDTILGITTIEKYDELSFIIKTNKRNVFLQEFFWWS